MKNLTNKQKIIAVSILVGLFCIGFLIGTFTGVGRKNIDNNEIDFNNEIKKVEELTEYPEWLVCN